LDRFDRPASRAFALFAVSEFCAEAFSEPFATITPKAAAPNRRRSMLPGVADFEWQRYFVS
jgi:hypothetical protein